MKLRVKDRLRLERIGVDLRDGLAFLQADNVAIMMQNGMTSSDMFTAPYYPGEKYAKIEKQIGSKFCVLVSAINKLEEALKEIT